MNEKKILFLSRLSDQDRFGGAFLRNDSIEKIYSSLGFEVQKVFLNQVSTRYGFTSYLKALIYGLKTRLNFSTAEIETGGYKFVHLDHLKQFRWKQSVQCPLIYNAHNLDSELFFEDRNSKSHKKFLRYEIEQMKRCHVVFLCSEREKERLLEEDKSIEAKLFVLPNLIDKSHYQSHPEKNIVSFVGSLDYYPNIEAVEYLCREFGPRIELEKYPDMRFVIAGKSPSHELKSLVKDSIFELIEKPDTQEMSEILSKTLISLVPLEFGSGTRLKIIEAVFSGSRVLSTPIGAEGFDSSWVLKVQREEFFDAFLKLANQREVIFDQDHQNFIEMHDWRYWLDKNQDKLNAIFERL